MPKSLWLKKELVLHIVILSIVFGSFIAALAVTKDLTILLVMIITILFGIGTWFLGYKVTPKLTGLFFQMQKFSWLHLLPKPEILKDENYFLSNPTKNSVGSLFLLWIGSWALVVFIAKRLVELGIQIPLPELALSNEFDVLIFGWLLTPLVAFIVLPISVIESSNLRIFLKSKNTVISPTTPYRYVIGGFATLGVLLTILQKLELAEMLAGVLFIPAPFYIMAFLHRIRTEKSLIAVFKSYLNKKGIVEKEINLS